MDLIMVLGPMKSGKSFDLISYFAPLKYSDIKFGLFQSVRNVRDEGVRSRNGNTLHSQKINSLKTIVDCDYQVIGIDEIHMFDDEESDNIHALLKKGVKVIVAGLDTDYRGRLIDIISRLMALGPREIRHKRAVCEHCRTTDAVYTQVYYLDKPIIGGMPSVIPEDGTFSYKPVCRHCFIQDKKAGEFTIPHNITNYLDSIKLYQN